MLQDRTVLYVFSGLPGVGKSAIAKKLVQKVNAAYLRIDTIEQGIRELCSFEVMGEGYRLSYRIAMDNLQNGVSVVADSCNPVNLTRCEWSQVADEAGVEIINIQVICSNIEKHRRRVENRVSEVANLRLPTWDEVVGREYHLWDESKVITIDTASKSIEESFFDLLMLLNLCDGR